MKAPVTKMRVYLATISATLCLGLCAASPAFADPTSACGTAAAELTKTWSTGDSFGDSDFGGSYSATATLTGKRDGLEIGSNLTADAQIFGNKQNIVKIDADAQAAVIGKSVSESVDVFVVGKNIFHHSRSTGTSDGSGVKLNLAKSWDVTFFTTEARIFIGPIPVKVKVTTAGTVGINFDSDLGILAVKANIKPSAKATATASAAADIGIASAGVDGQVMLLDASVPSSGQINLTTDPGLTWQMDSDMPLSYLSGQLNVFAKLLGKRYEKKIADYKGTTKTISLAHESGCIKFL